MFSLSYGLYVNLGYGPCSSGYGPCSSGYDPCSIEIRVSIQSAYAYIYHGVFVCAVFIICIFLFA
jgi:hypothetical protein